ncbi:hypothetical protein Dimus_030233, partial [Dionaea muscipula]
QWTSSNKQRIHPVQPTSSTTTGSFPRRAVAPLAGIVHGRGDLAGYVAMKSGTSNGRAAVQLGGDGLLHFGEQLPPASSDLLGEQWR